MPPPSLAGPRSGHSARVGMEQPSRTHTRTRLPVLPPMAARNSPGSRHTNGPRAQGTGQFNGGPCFAARPRVGTAPCLTSPAATGPWRAQTPATTLSLRTPNKASSAPRWRTVSGGLRALPSPLLTGQGHSCQGSAVSCWGTRVSLTGRECGGEGLEQDGDSSLS